ncbi:MAG: hypothetical protein F6K42_19940, partial [Leptolyngbya sp. SIO1D8]|nr:hypothetical protein [Leptolyngbya sp. SIO1D8]
RKFGFRAQQQVYVQRENRADEFLVVVGWQDALGLGNVNLLTRRKPYRDLQFRLDAPAGHLPTWRWGADTLEGAYVVDEELVDTVFLHLEKCMPTAGLGAMASPSDGGQSRS